MSQTLKKAKKPKAPKMLLDLGPHDCRWPIGEPRQEGFHFCGEAQLAGRPYCAHHWGVAFQPSKPRHSGHQAAPALPTAALPPGPAKKAA